MTTMPQYFDDEIDLREVIRPVLRSKWWILGITIVLMVSGYLFSKLLLPKQYQAVSYVVITRPLYSANFDNRIETQPQIPDAKSLTDLTSTDDILVSLSESPELQNILPPDQTLEELAGMLEPTLIGTSLRLQATAMKPENAAAVANQWARLVVNKLDDLYGIGVSTLSTVQQQTEDARLNWETAENDLLAYLPQSNQDALQVTFSIKRTALSTNLQKMTDIKILLGDLGVMKAQFDARQGADALQLEDRVALVSLQQRVVGNSGGILIQINPDLTGAPYLVSEARQNLDEMVASLQVQNQALQDEAAQLEIEINQIAIDLETVNNRLAQLTTQRDIAKNAYQALSNQVEETRISLSQEDQIAKIASDALPPTKSSGPRSLINGILIGAFGFLAAVLFVLLMNWWKGPETGTGEKPSPKQ
jgi:uncharacterized protein involved in exopolysaccharide biosynthesis